MSFISLDNLSQLQSQAGFLRRQIEFHFRQSRLSHQYFFSQIGHGTPAHLLRFVSAVQHGPHVALCSAYRQHFSASEGLFFEITASPMRNYPFFATTFGYAAHFDLAAVIAAHDSRLSPFYARHAIIWSWSSLAPSWQEYTVSDEQIGPVLFDSPFRFRH